MGIKTVGDLDGWSEKEMQKRFGRNGAIMIRQAQGFDERPVITEHERKSVSQERTFARDLRDVEPLHDQLSRLSQRVAQHLQKAGVAAGTVAIKLRYADFTTLGRQMRLSVPTDDGETICQVARTLFDRTWQRGRPVRLLGVAGRQLSPPPGQLRLFEVE